MFEPFFEPHVLHDLRVRIEKTGKESSEQRREPSWASKFSLLNLLAHGHDVLVMKGQIPSYQNEEYNPTRLDVDLGGIVALPAENLRGNVNWCVAECVEEAVLATKTALRPKSETLICLVSSTV